MSGSIISCLSCMRTRYDCATSWKLRPIRPIWLLLTVRVWDVIPRLSRSVGRQFDQHHDAAQRQDAAQDAGQHPERRPVETEQRIGTMGRATPAGEIAFTHK